MTDKVQDTLEQRGGRYGPIEREAEISQGILDQLRGARNWELTSPIQRHALTMIATKMARIVNGDPNYLDNWHDIQGYAKLVEQDLEDDRL